MGGYRSRCLPCLHGDKHGLEAPGSGSKVELIDGGGTVRESSDISSLSPGAVSETSDDFTNGFESCKVVSGSSSTLRANLTVFFWDGTKYLSLATDDAR
jgi:hypothetical protein